MALSKTTQDHDEIQKWAEARGAKPAEVAGTEQDGETGILRIEFPKATDANNANLKEISWDEFFEKFDNSRLSLVYQELTADGEQSNFNKLVHPENLSPSAKKSAKSARAEAAKKPARSSSKSTPTKSSAGGRKSASTKKSESKFSAKTSPAKNSATSRPPAKKQTSKSTGAKRPSVSLRASIAKTASKQTSTSKKAATKSTKSSKIASKRTGR